MAAVHAVTVPLLPPCPPAHGLQRVRSGEVAPSGPAAYDPVWWLLHEATVLQVGSPRSKRRRALPSQPAQPAQPCPARSAWDSQALHRPTS